MTKLTHTKRKTGRPPTRPNPLDYGILDALTERLVSGESMREICEDPQMPSQTAVYLAMIDSPNFRRGIARAREAQQEALIDSTIDIADEATPETCNVAKLRIWARQWRAAKLAPKVYGDRIQVEDTTPKTTLSREEIKAQLLASGLKASEIFEAITRRVEPLEVVDSPLQEAEEAPR
jgi:hypothetical protein